MVELPKGKKRKRDEDDDGGFSYVFWSITSFELRWLYPVATRCHDMLLVRLLLPGGLGGGEPGGGGWWRYVSSTLLSMALSCADSYSCDRHPKLATRQYLPFFEHGLLFPGRGGRWYVSSSIFHSIWATLTLTYVTDIPSSPPDSVFRFSNMDYSFLGDEDDDGMILLHFAQ